MDNGLGDRSMWTPRHKYYTLARKVARAPWLYLKIKMLHFSSNIV